MIRAIVRIVRRLYPYLRMIAQEIVRFMLSDNMDPTIEQSEEDIGD